MGPWFFAPLSPYQRGGMVQNSVAFQKIWNTKLGRDGSLSTAELQVCRVTSLLLGWSPSWGDPAICWADPRATITLLLRMLHFLKNTSVLEGVVRVANRRSFLFLCFAIFMLLFLTQVFSILISSRWKEMPSPEALCTAAGHPRLQQFGETASLPNSPVLFLGVSCHDMALWGKV